MFIRFLLLAFLIPIVVNPLTSRSATLSSGTIVLPLSVQAVEYYNAELDHYFMTADAMEMGKLDSGQTRGWARTGFAFSTFASAPMNITLGQVCRFYGRPEAGLDSHFYSGANDECAAVITRFSSSWQLESTNVFQVQMPDRATGACPSGMSEVYRLFNNRSDANHRYTTDAGIKQAMIARGYVSEGYGTSGVAFCATNPTGTGGGTTTPPTNSPASVSILVTQVATDTFDFSSSASPSTGATVAAYVWNFGDGDSATGSSASHKFSVSGTFPVVLTITDTSGATASATRSVTAAVSGTAPPPPTTTGTSSNFDTRKTAAGVIRWFDFDSAAQLGGGYGANFGVLPGSSTAPVIDTAVKSSGGGSMRFDVPSQSGSDAAGTWFANFSSDLATQFGENSEFFVQWRQRFNQAFIDTYFVETDGSAQGGIKQAIITTGDQPSKVYNSCEAIGNVVQSYYQHRFPIVYNSCTGSGSHPPYSGMYERISGDFNLQNGLSCTYSASQAAAPTAVPSGCFGWVANEWLTFQVGITLGARDNVNNDFSNSRVRLWAARDGQPSVLLVDWKPGVGGYFPLAAGPLADNQRFGKVWLLPYMTNKNPTQVHGLAQTWYDELIISRQQIPDSTGGPTTTGAGSTTPPPTTTTTTSNLATLGANTAANLGAYQCTEIDALMGPCSYVTDYSSMVYDPRRQQMVVFGGGHSATNYDAVNTFRSSSLRWVEEYLPTPLSAITAANYDSTNGAWRSGPDGGPYPRAAARHTVDLMQVVGDELILLGKVDGNAATGPYTNLAFTAQGRIAHYNFVTKTWSFTSIPGTGDWSASAYDPISGKIVIVGAKTLSIYDPVARTRLVAVDFETVSGATHILDEQGNQLSNTLGYNTNLVYFPPDQMMYYFEAGSRTVWRVELNRADFSQSVIRRLTTTGTPPATGETGYGYDSRNQIIGGAISNNTFYAFDPAAKSWTSKTIQGGAPGTVAFHALDYDTVNNVFIFVTDYASGRKTWAYRYQ